MLKLLLSVLVVLCTTSYIFGQTPSIQITPQSSTTRKHLLTDTVGVVNGQVIRLYDFRNSLSENIERAAEAGEIKGDSVTPQGMTRFVDQTWDELIDEILFEAEIYRRHFNASDSEALHSLLASPTPAQKKEFSDSTGAFDPEMMRSAFQDPANDSVVTLILEATKLDLERERLLRAIGGGQRGGTSRNHAVDLWLREQHRKARILDNRAAFGYY